MGSNQRKVYNAAAGANGEQEACPHCGCKHFEYSMPFGLTYGAAKAHGKITRKCRNCGRTVTVKIK